MIAPYRRRRRPRAKSEVVTVGELFQAHALVIPDYQREFSWDETNIEEFVQDLRAAFREIDPAFERAEPEYCLGSIVIQVADAHSDGESWQVNPANRTDADRMVEERVVDGQQRITCLVILLCVLASRTSAEVRAEVLSLIERPRAGRPDFVLRADGYDVVLAQFLMDAPVALQARGETAPAHVQRLRYAFNAMRASLEDVTHPQSVADHFALWLLDRVYVSVIADIDPEDDQRVFDRINTRGKHLSDAERFRTRVLAEHPPRMARSKRETAKRWASARETAVAITATGRNPRRPADVVAAEQIVLTDWLIGRRLGDGGLAERVETARQIERDCYAWAMRADGPARLVETLRTDFFPFVEKAGPLYKWAQTLTPHREGFRTAALAKTPYAGALGAALLADRRSGETELRLVSRFLDVASARRVWSRTWRDLNGVRELSVAAIGLLGSLRGEALAGGLRGLFDDWTPFTAETPLRLTGANRRFVRYLLARLALHVEVDDPDAKAKALALLGDAQGAGGGELVTIAFPPTAPDHDRLGAIALLSPAASAKAQGRPLVERAPFWAGETRLARSLIEPVASAGGVALPEPAEPGPALYAAREEAYAALANALWSPATIVV